MTENTWYTDEINDLYNQGIVTGYPDGMFYPENFVTRAEAVTMLGRALNLPGTPNITMFSDVYKRIILLVISIVQRMKKLSQDFQIRRFRPNSYIKRGDVATILQRSYQYSIVDGDLLFGRKE